MEMKHRNQPGTDGLEGLERFFAAAREERRLPAGLEQAILRDAASMQPKRRSIQNHLAASAEIGWRQVALLAASAVTGLAVGLSSASAVESVAAGMDPGPEIAGADIFSGLDELLAEE